MRSNLLLKDPDMVTRQAGGLLENYTKDCKIHTLEDEICMAWRRSI
jgi:hypothetical protein